MHELGIDTIEGWFDPQFDEVTLDSATGNGIGVVLPFEINQDWPLDNPNVRQSILDRVTACVECYKNNPAVCMWAPGNENLHRILYPHWMSADRNADARARDAFAVFLPELVGRIHELDPNHPVPYRDAEDVYLPRLRAALRGDRRLASIARVRIECHLTESPTRDCFSVAQPVARRTSGDSEFAPGGAGPADRPLGISKIGPYSCSSRHCPWQIIRHLGDHWSRGAGPRVWAGRRQPRFRATVRWWL